MSFVHLHMHSHFSLLEASSRIKEICKQAADCQMPGVALTDYGNMFGAIEFYFAAREYEIKPLVGLEVYLAPHGRTVKKIGAESQNKPNTRLVLLAQNIEGYRNLCAISSVGYQEGFYYKPRVDYETLAKYNGSVIALSGHIMGDISWSFRNEGPEQALEKLTRLKAIYPDRFYLELARMGVTEWDGVNDFLLETAHSTKTPYVATNNVHYLHQADQIAQEVLICVGTNRTLHDESRYRLGSDQFYFKDTSAMEQLFEAQPAALAQTLEIMDRCDLQLKLTHDDGKPIYHLPSFPIPKSETTKGVMWNLSHAGLENRFKEYEDRDESISEADKVQYYDRLKYELGVIDGMGFNGYFLIVQDFIAWAKDNGVPVGPGRGSGAGSLVAYSLLVTDLDPIPYRLVFERFLNPERISMPDFDIDFCQEKRQSVIRYVTEKYGRESVSQIITFGKLQTRAAIRDVGRVLGMTFAEVDVVSKLIPDVLGITLKEAIEQEPRLTELTEADPKIQTLLDLAAKVEGLVRHAGIHAAGVVISDGNIVSHAPLYRGNDGENVVQYDMKHSEKIGLIKFDFLGLKTLTHINEAFRLVNRNREELLTTKDISLRDAGIYELLCDGDTAGIFQFESEGITDLIRKSQPNCFEDIVAINALYRPGPMEKIPDYLAFKKGEKKVVYAFPEIEEITKETYGIVVYQEQVQLISAKIASYSLGEADLLRRAMGKKIPEVMEQQKERFMKGAIENKFDAKKASKLFDSMAEFAKYGFNKSHAAAYCVIAAQTAWLKRYYPVEFYAALLGTEMNDTDKVVKYVKDAHKHDIVVKAPHVNSSQYKFSVEEGQIYFALGAIKGVGQAAVEAILEARNLAGPFISLDTFFERVDLRRVNKKTVECLIKAGALDDFGAHRAKLMNGYQKFVERADRTKQDASIGQASLFSLDEEVLEQEKVRLLDCPQWGRTTRLTYEKEVLGFYLSDHPLNGFMHLASPWTSVAGISSLSSEDVGNQVKLLGVLVSLREIITKKGTRMAFCQLEDLTGSLELIVFPKSYVTAELILKSEAPMIVSGKIEGEDEAFKMIVEKVERMENVFSQAKSISIDLDKLALTQKHKLANNTADEDEGEAALGQNKDKDDGENRTKSRDNNKDQAVMYSPETKTEKNPLKMSANLNQFEATTEGQGAEPSADVVLVEDYMKKFHELSKKHPGSAKLYLIKQMKDLNRTVRLEVKDPPGCLPSFDFVESSLDIFGDVSCLQLHI